MSDEIEWTGPVRHANHHSSSHPDQVVAAAGYRLGQGDGSRANAKGGLRSLAQPRLDGSQRGGAGTGSRSHSSHVGRVCYEHEHRGLSQRLGLEWGWMEGEGSEVTGAGEESRQPSPPWNKQAWHTVDYLHPLSINMCQWMCQIQKRAERRSRRCQASMRENGRQNVQWRRAAALSSPQRRHRQAW